MKSHEELQLFSLKTNKKKTSTKNAKGFFQKDISAFPYEDTLPRRDETRRDAKGVCSTWMDSNPTSISSTGQEKDQVKSEKIRTLELQNFLSR